MADPKNVDKSREGELLDDVNPNIVTRKEDNSVAESVKSTKSQHVSSSSERQFKFERAQKALENAALVSKRIKEHRKATAELLGRPFEDDDVGETAEAASTLSERTGYSVATDTSTTLSVQDALNIPGISESLANTLKQKEILMEKIKQYKEISKRPMKSSVIKKDLATDTHLELKKTSDKVDVTQFMKTIKEKDTSLSIMQVKVKALETTILDLQEKINEKDQIIEAKNMATTLMSDTLSKKEKDSLLLLEDTRHQMAKMQENFITMEIEWKEERQRLLKEIEVKDDKIKSLEEANTILENARFEVTIANSKLLEEIEKKNQEILNLQENIKTLSEVKLQEEKSIKNKEDFEEEKGSLEISQMVELTKKIELLEQLNCQIRQTNIELENKLSNVNEPKISAVSSPSKKASPLPSRKGGRNSASKMKSPWSNISLESLPQDTEKKTNKNEIAKLEMLVQSLNKDILDKEYAISHKETLLTELQTSNKEKDDIITDLKARTESRCRVDVGTDVIDLAEPNIVDLAPAIPDDNVDPYAREETSHYSEIIELQKQLEIAQQQIGSLNEEIDLANKNMIKVKSNHKLKLKQMQKTIDNFSKISDTNAEIVKLNEELHQLSQKVAELEEEKGNLQLHLVDYDSGRLTESDVYKKMIEMENLAETRLKAISVLEAQKFDLVQDLHVLQQKNSEMEDKLADMSQLHNEQVCSEMKSVQLEEQIDELIAARKEQELIIENLKLDKEQLNGTIQLLQEEKEQLMQKLGSYIQENIELTDKLEKMGAEKVSSAESIEIVESLTTQEKLELEEYNKGIMEIKESGTENVSHNTENRIESLTEHVTELNKKIDLFTQERQEVMDKMNSINSENEKLHLEINQMNDQCSSLQSNIDLLNQEKNELQSLNDELSRQIVELKHVKLDIVKENAEAIRPIVVEESLEGSAEIQHDDKTSGEKSVNRNKSVKQLTKEILKLKNTIKEREAEIGDCQMKILSLEEQHQKQNELIQAITSYEAKIKCLTDENQILKEKMMKNKENEDYLIQLKQSNELLQDELRRTHQDYTNTITARDARIHELENVLIEYDNQILNYGNTLQQKDKEMVEYLNQITKLNDVSQKLKSTIEMLEEEKTKDQNADMIKTLNKQISVYQKKLGEYEEKLKILEEDKNQLLSHKAALENKNMNIEAELKKLQELFIEKQNVIKELQILQQKHVDEMSNVKLQSKERDEEIHEIKLQLRKESIENEKLRTLLTEKDKAIEEYSHINEETKRQVIAVSNEKAQLSENLATAETKNKEFMEKLKKCAISIKKKSSMYIELENQYHNIQKDLEYKNELMEQLSIQVDTLPALQEKLKHAEEEINRLQSQKAIVEQLKSQENMLLHQDIDVLNQKLNLTSEEINKLNDALNNAHKDLHLAQEDNQKLKVQVDSLSNKLVEYEIEQKNNMNFTTKISTLETDINQKQTQIVELLQKLENQEQSLSRLQFGHDAKVQERDLYIESLETEINKYKSRICRLEESISVMEDRRSSLERKADQLDSQLQEKQKAYSEYSNQEDELINRLAVLIDHDRVVEKQLHEIEIENRQLQDKMHNLTEENQRLRKSISDVQEHYNNLIDTASKAEAAESEVLKYQSQLRDLESQYRRIIHEHQSMMTKKKQDIEDLESEFNTQIENAIKEKKILSEKYEKICEHVTRLENKLQEYNNENERIKINMEEVNRLNQELMVKSVSYEQSATPDYTEQYISEINKLNSIINSKNQEIDEINGKLHTLQINGVATVSNLESKISELSNKLVRSTEDIDRLMKENISLKETNEQLDQLLAQKDDQIKELKDKKRVTFEMNIPKTEGMLISSTIEAIEEPIKLDISDLESQIVTGEPIQCEQSQIFIPDTLQKSHDVGDGTKNVVEEVIVPKKAYLCYKGEANSNEESDPFNSDEGWGLGESEDVGENVQGLTQLKEDMHQLQKDNDLLKKDLDTTNVKLLKLIKKYKELKSNNESLLNELKMSRQLSQSSFLDSAIEDELRNNIQNLEKKLEELNADLIKEKREKESVKKQNEVISSANEKLMEMKEKLDSEIELWKFRFKEVNDKIATLHWTADSKDSPIHKPNTNKTNIREEVVTDEIVKLEKENDELQGLVDQLTAQNSEFSNLQANLRNEISNLKHQLQQQVCKNCEILKDHLSELEKHNAELLKTIDVSNQKLKDLELRYNEAKEQCEMLKSENDEIQSKFEKANKELNDKYVELERKLKLSTEAENVANIKIDGLQSEIDLLNNKINLEQGLSENNMILSEKCGALEENCLQLQQNFNETTEKLEILEALNQELKQKILDYENQIVLLNSKIENIKIEKDNLTSNLSEFKSAGSNQEMVNKITDYEQQIVELNSKIQNLNTENDQLLSTVAELRSSVSSAVDQRGFEIAELWKQHLAQREADFLKTEQELRAELTASETKYEQLLDSIQSSSQEETDKLIMMEQINSLQNKITDKEEHLYNLQDKYGEAINQLDILRSEVEDEKLLYENKFLSQQEEYENMLKDLELRNKELAQKYELDTINNQNELFTVKEKNVELNKTVDDLKGNIEKLEATIVDLNNQLQIKESEVYQKCNEYTITLTQRNQEFENVRKHMLEYEKKIEDLSFEKESELALLRLKMHENVESHDKVQAKLDAEKSTLTEALNSKIVECTNLNKQITDLNKSLEEHTTKCTEMQTALENQELEIVTLKDEIFSLQQILKKTSNKIEKHVTFASDTKSTSDGEPSDRLINKDLLDAVPRAELDLALYMLHQRDVRCEELTMELTQLLEERDTLQLRLSDSLRSNEELKTKFKSTELDMTTDSQENVSELPSFSIEKEAMFVDTHRGQTSRNSSVSDVDSDKPKLQAKLSELRSVKHSRDVRLRQESEQRQMDLRLLQRDVANLPPEAVDQLAQAHHTLSRDSQSTSTVLLNWLRGKSTPKVVHM
ncbi:unnamed protein product [Diatraea saccharalis]|uniref:Uncharacterized protein n=1 Tax=Diatraea saccharalis TaxID=40085 RepID=A0A9N9R8X2_9NEOP|nr:unnamed protein product [Diatraea saccharalis]